MDIYPGLVRKAILPTVDIFRGTRISYHLDLFEKNQWMSIDELKSYQEKQLRELIEHAYRNVPFYHRVMKERNLKPDDIKSVKDLQKLPVISKADIRKAPKDFLSKDFDSYRPKQFGTSGTSGEPFRYYLDNDRWSANQASMYYAFAVGGFNIGQKRMIFAPVHLYPGQKPELIERIQNKALRKIVIQSLKQSDDLLQYTIKTINSFRPVMLEGHPSFLDSLAYFISENNLEVHQPSLIFTYGEKLYEHQKKRINNTFSSEVFEGYGGSDVGVATVDCTEHNRHICIDTGIMEFLDERGEPVSSGEKGDIITTMTNNFSQSFIRYSPGDVGIPSDETCPCGRGHPLIAEVIGRTLDNIILPNGTVLGATSLTAIFRDFNLKQYQIIQYKTDKIEVKAIKGGKYKDDETPRLQSIMAHYCGKDVQIDLNFVDNIPLTKAGKRKYIISHLDE